MPDYAMNKTIVSGNGIDPLFFADGSNDRFTLIYASHPLYGLKTLLKAWPEIHAQIPEARLEVYYGWTPGMIRCMLPCVCLSMCVRVFLCESLHI